MRRQEKVDDHVAFHYRGLSWERIRTLDNEAKQRAAGDGDAPLPCERAQRNPLRVYAKSAAQASAPQPKARRQRLAA